LHEADYRCAVSNKLTIWKQRCWELKRLFADVVELEVHRRTKTRKVLLAFLTKRRLVLSKCRELLDPAAYELETGRKPCDQVEAAIEESIQLLHVSKLHQQSRTPIFNRARYQLINGVDEVSLKAMMAHASTAPLYDTSMLKNSLTYDVTLVSFKLGREPEWREGIAVITTFQHLHLFAVTNDNNNKKTSDDCSKGDCYSISSTPSLELSYIARKAAMTDKAGISRNNNNNSLGSMNFNNNMESGSGRFQRSSEDMKRSGGVSSVMTLGLRNTFKRGSSVNALTSSPRSKNNNNNSSRKVGLSESCPWSEFNSASTVSSNNSNNSNNNNNTAALSGGAPMSLSAFDAHHEEALTHKPKACVWLSTCAFGISADGGHVELIPNFDDEAVKVYLRFHEDEDNIDNTASPASQSRAATWVRNTQAWAFLAAQQ
jgi:hypothetical protein